MQKCSILINTCDKYEDIWTVFIKMLEIQWPKCPYTIYLNTETKRYDSTDCKLKIVTLNFGNGGTWSERLQYALSQIPEKYILFTLEDFFPQDTIDQERIENILKWVIESKEKIANVCFYPGAYLIEETYCGLAKIPKNRQYISKDIIMNCQVGFWNKFALLELINSKETPWEFEEDGSRRALQSDWEFYRQMGNQPEGKNNPWKYALGVHNGYGVARGKWLWNNKKLFEKYGIEADFTWRETYTSYQQYLDELKCQKEGQSIVSRIVERLYEFRKRIME